jgi:hypothetical protein
MSAVKNTGPSRYEHFVLDDTAAKMRVGTDQDMVGQIYWVSLDTPDDGVFHDNATGANRNRTAFTSNHRTEKNSAIGPNGHVAAEHNRRRDISRVMDLGPSAVVFYLNHHSNSL